MYVQELQFRQLTKQFVLSVKARDEEHLQILQALRELLAGADLQFFRRGQLQVWLSFNGK